MKDPPLVPISLRRWFVVHCIVDLIFGLPLFFFPEETLEIFDWPYYDPLTSRLVAAALLGIGLESYFSSQADITHLAAMLRLKLIWSGSATAGLLITFVNISHIPWIGYMLVLIFAVFHLLWWYFLIRIRSLL